MKPVIGALLIFVGLEVAYLVISGKLPLSSAMATGSTPPNSASTSTSTTSTKAGGLNVGDNRGGPQVGKPF